MTAAAHVGPADTTADAAFRTEIRDWLAEHLTGRHRWVLATTRSDGRPQMSWCRVA